MILFGILLSDLWYGMCWITRIGFYLRLFYLVFFFFLGIIGKNGSIWRECGFAFNCVSFFHQTYLNLPMSTIFFSYWNSYVLVNLLFPLCLLASKFCLVPFQDPYIDACVGDIFNNTSFNGCWMHMYLRLLIFSINAYVLLGVSLCYCFVLILEKRWARFLFV